MHCAVQCDWELYSLATAQASSIPQPHKQVPQSKHLRFEELECENLKPSLKYFVLASATHFHRYYVRRILWLKRAKSFFLVTFAILGEKELLLKFNCTISPSSSRRINSAARKKKIFQIWFENTDFKRPLKILKGYKWFSLVVVVSPISRF